MTKKAKTPKLKKYPHSTWREHRDGTFYLSVFYSYKDALGKHRRVESICRDESLEGVIEVRKKLKELAEIKINTQRFGVMTNDATTKFGDFAQLWLDYKRKTLREETVNNYEQQLNAHVLPVFKDEYLSDITTAQLRKLIDKIAATAPRSAQLCYYSLNNLFKYAMREFISANPLTGIEYPKYKSQKAIHPLTKDEAKKFIKLCAKAKHGLIFQLALFTGMRPEEYLGLKYSDIDFQTNRITIKSAIAMKLKGVNFKGVKSKNSGRTIPLPAKLAAKLKKHVKNVQSLKLIENHDLVFPNELGGKLTLKNLNERHLRPLIEKVSNKPSHLYMLRHTCATLLLIAGENPKAVSERLGNSVEVVLKTYSHVSPNTQQTASEKLEKMLN